MIKTLSNITDISVIDQNVKDDILSFAKIEFDDNELGSGGFGSVHRVQSIDGKSKKEFVLKIFTDDDNKEHAYKTIELLHQKIKKRQQKTKLPIYYEFPELLGLPFIAFKGYNDTTEKHCVAFLMYNLEKLDYEDYGSDASQLKDYKKLKLNDKLYLAYQLSKTIDFLHQINFIHADLSENSLWFNSKRKQLAIIDFDSGYHFDAQDKPTTIGKIGHWIGSKFRNIIRQKKDSANLTTLDRLYEEYWVLANANFEIIFGVMPFFFLSDTDDNTKKTYLKKHVWPNIEYSSDLFNKANTNQHQSILDFLSQLENAGFMELIEAFKIVFNSGYTAENKRLTSKEWRDLLFVFNESLENKPLIKWFKSSKNSIKQKNEKVSFSFDAEKYNRIYVDNVLVPFNKNKITLSFQDDKQVTLKAVNDFEIVEDFIEIKADKIAPIISKFKATKLMRDSLDPIELSWSVENAKTITITNTGKLSFKDDSVKVKPIVETSYILTAVGFFDEEITSEITIDVIKPIIESFTWEINLDIAINNIDLNWQTSYTESVEISPNVKEKNPIGTAHVTINKETIFKLIAKGLFSNIEKEITAQPFPVPVVKLIFAEAPKIEITTNIDLKEVNFPKELLTVNNIQFSNEVHFNNFEIDSTELKNTLEFPLFEYENVLEKKIYRKKITVTDIYKRAIKKINKKLHK
jgi:serine/threonine protein kinase